jgi:hypothetical protein
VTQAHFALGPQGGGGELLIDVWPTYAGLSAGHPGFPPTAAHEPFFDLNYQRGQILWTPVKHSSEVTGVARVFLPAGTYTHLLFFRGPGLYHFVDHQQLDFALVWDKPGLVDLDVQHRHRLERR